MKKTIFSLLSVLLASITVTAQQYDVRLNLPVNVKVPLSVNTFTETEVNIPGQGLQKINQTQKNEIVFSVVEKKGDNYVINCVINTYDIITNVDGKEQKISATDKEETMQNKQIKAVTGKIVQAEVTPYFKLVGEVKPITEGLDQKNANEIFKTYQDLFEELYCEQPLEQGKTIELQSGKKTIKKTLSSVSNDVYTLDNKWVESESFNGLPMKGNGVMSYEIHKETGIPLYGLMTLPLEGSMPTPNGVVSVKVKVTCNISFIQ